MMDGLQGVGSPEDAELQEAMLEAVPLPAFLVDEDARISSCNRAAREQLALLLEYRDRCSGAT